MMMLLAWTLLTLSLWTSGSSQILQQEPVKVLYPELLSTEAIECDCVNISCESVYWFRSNHDRGELKYLGKCNNAERAFYGEGVDKTRFKLCKKSSASFTLRIINVTEEDAGSYSCVLKGRKNTEMWRSGILLRPGESSPTSPPETKPKPPVKPVCRCPSENPPQEGCGSQVLWTLVGLVAALAVALVGSLYYFSRLPKKCRHTFVK
ncbi:uncharacterized protein cd8b [Clinocottus analis]|uniref:uncharacterized protein cd8b n=1 Tax=Clinocottus analis TaxID=304258 RepID=UPI0035C2415E